MAIRGPGGPRPDAGAPLPREQPRSPTQRLIDFGSAKTPQEALKLLKEILTLLAAAGFPVPKTGQPEQQLSSSLKQLQQQEGLPQTGQLDQQTFEALDRLGLLPKKEAAPESIDQKQAKQANPDAQFQIGGPRLGGDRGLPRGGGEVPAGTQKTRTVETEQARARADNSKPEVDVDLKSMLNALKQAGFLGAGKGKEQLQDAVKKLQRVDGLPATGQLDAKTAAALEKRGVIDAPTAQALKEQDPTYAPPAPSTSEPSSDAAGTQRGDEARGQGGPDGASAGKGAGAGGEGSGVVVGGGRVDPGDVDGSSDASLDERGGNNYAGDDDDDDEARGEANVEGDDASAFDHWEVKKLAQQAEEGLAAIVRDDDGAGPATYGWELRLFRPGVYSARQPAEELLHLVVKNAGPFDAVWQQALDAVNDKLARYEPGADAVEVPALKLALQRARYRDA
jgi:hypothetical protein